MRRPVPTLVTALVTALLTTGASLTGAGTASAAPRITLQDHRVSISPPISSRPMRDQCTAGGLNHPWCGLGTVHLTLSGFDAVGGIPACPTPEGDGGCEGGDPLAHVETGTFGTRLDVVVRCTGDLFPRFRSVPLVTGSGLGPGTVDARTRVDGDTAEVVAVFVLPAPGELADCLEEDSTDLLHAAVRNLTVGFHADTDLLTSWTTRVPGYHRVDLR